MSGEETVLDVWHPVKPGEWLHISQVTKGNMREFYTDGKLILKAKVSDVEYLKVFPL